MWGTKPSNLSYIPWTIPWTWVWEFCSCVIKFSGDFLCSSWNIAVGVTIGQGSLQIICVEWEDQWFLTLEPFSRCISNPVECPLSSLSLFAHMSIQTQQLKNHWEGSSYNLMLENFRKNCFNFHLNQVCLTILHEDMCVSVCILLNIQ